MPKRARLHDLRALVPELLRFDRMHPDEARPCGRHCGDCPACIRCLDYHTEVLLAPDAEVWVSGSALIYFTDVDRPHEAQLHVVCFDGRLRARLPVIFFCMGQVGVQRIYCALPDTVAGLVAVGERYMGMRRSMRFEELLAWRGGRIGVTVIERQMEVS